MIQEFVDSFMTSKPTIRAIFQSKHPDDYKEIVKIVVSHLGSVGYNRPDPDRIHEIDDGDYQGTLVYVIGASGYQPSTYWSVMVDYGSCSGCDTLESIQSCSYGEEPNEEQVDDYMTLALHIVQGLKLMNNEIV